MRPAALQPTTESQAARLGRCIELDRQPARRPFVDGSSQAGVAYQYDSGASDRLFIADTMGGGVGLFDYDNDGWLDIYFVNGCAIPFDSKNPPRPNRLVPQSGTTARFGT